jgi:hypothetical protein
MALPTASLPGGRPWTAAPLSEGRTRRDHGGDADRDVDVEDPPPAPGLDDERRAVAFASARLAAFVQLDAQHLRQLLVHRLLDGRAHVLVNQDSEGKLLMHGLQLLDSLAHGVFLRSLPSRATGWWFPNRKNAPFSFSTSRATRPHANVRGCFIVVDVDALLARQR